MTHTADERKFWADAFCAMMSADRHLDITKCAEYCDMATALYRQRLGNCSETPNGSLETDDAMAAFRTALSNAQLPRAAAATSYFMQGDEVFSVRVRRETCAGTSEASDSPPPSFSGEPEPITEDVLRSLGMCVVGGVGRWQLPCDNQATVVYEDVGSHRFATDLTDARKLRAIMEIVRA